MDINTKSFPVDLSVINSLARSYNTLDYLPKLKNTINNIYPSIDLTNCTKFELHKLINDTLFKNYCGEEVLKYKLFKLFVNKKVVAAFEMNVDKSRLDFLTINGDSRSYEIKSKLDNLQKLKKQSSDYVKAFEFNHIVISNSHLYHALEIVPTDYGIWCFDKGNKFVYRDAVLNEHIDIEFQLSLLTKKEREKTFENKGDIKSILKCTLPQQINFGFKNALKDRYYTRWNFIQDNKDKILPIDLQFFFNTNICPEIIYT